MDIQPARHRAAPRRIPVPAFYLVIWLAVVGIWLPKPWGLVTSAPAILVGLIFWVQRWRYAGWVLERNQESTEEERA